ncbi:MAG: MFS transporter [Sedimentibacter sp.]|uniref:MFS transporter n=1 Tax=Sedimentibacter sp. TaxID=1960295 RepID=UPI0029813CBD|nr:MFS transporter [Sedimentibacter sp.]MDW5300334.1 MFS transporter [Sedimentibacter sp.]
MKIKLYSVIYFLNSYLSGLLIPVLSLLLIEKGASLSNLSIILGLYALTVVILELPTGIMADIFGRKKTFCISLIISATSFMVILFGRGFIIMCIGMMLYGLNRALASGSFDALFIDYYIDNFGKEKLHNITTRLSVLEALGLSTGAISGGFFPKVSAYYFPDLGTYDLNLIIRILLTVTVAVLSIIFITEAKKVEKHERISIKQHVKNSSSFVMENTTVICIFISVFSTGFFLSSLETYWQPHFISLLPDKGMMGLLGLMAFLYLGAAMLGSIVSNKLIKKYKFNSKKMYLTLRLLLALSLIFTALQTNIPSFISLYASIYLLFGMANIPEGAILNGETPSEIRASVLSTYSFIFQIGGLSGSILYSVIINYVSIPNIWIIAACIVLITVAITFKKFLSNSSEVSIETNK